MEDLKTNELRKVRSLNPHPEKVSCELFRGNDFFDPRDIPHVKYEMVRKVRVDKKPIRHVAREFGFSRPSAYKAVDTFHNSGAAGLLRTKPGPRRAHKLNDSVIAFIEAQRAEDPSITLSELVARIQQQIGVTVHRRSIQRMMSREKKGL